MNSRIASLLEQHFHTAFAAPDGIRKLRELILTLAMQGRLVAQDPQDPPASELLKEIAAEKKQLVREGRIKDTKPLPPIRTEEVPYELPQGWAWVRLGSVGEINPRNNREDDEESGFVPMPLISSEYGVDHKFEVRKWGDIKKGYTHFANEDVGLAKITPCFENTKSCVFHMLPNGIGAGTTELHIFRNTYGVVYPEYLLAYLKNPRYIETGIPKMTGSAGQKRVPTGFFSQNPFPLPPLPEQHRIVAKIDQLMTRCDELEKLRAEHDQKRLSVHTAALNQLLDTQEKEHFAGSVQFITRHFGELYTVKENVTELRKAILQLGVMGKLVPQDPHDPPARDLLKQITTEKQRLVKEGKIKEPKPLPELKPEEASYKLPKGWEWVRLGDISLGSDSGWSPQCLHEARRGDDWGVLKVSAVSWNDYNPNENKALSKDKTPRPECEVKAGDFLLSRANTDELVARSVIVNETPPKLMMSDKIVRISLSKYVNKVFINILNGSIMARAYYISNASGTSSSMKNVTRDVMIKLPLPLPPLPEQHRIVAKVDQLIALCDELEKQIDAATGKRAELLNALMAQV